MFWKKRSKEAAGHVMERPVTVEEIHETFRTEVDRLLAEAKAIKAAPLVDEGVRARAERLRALGFSCTKEVVIVDEVMAQARAVEMENEGKAALAAAIEYFSTRYPTYRFITPEGVKRICERYGLALGNVKDYIGDVPEANLKQLEEFRVSEEDDCCSHFLNVQFAERTFKGYLSSSQVAQVAQEREARKANVITRGEGADWSFWSYSDLGFESFIHHPLKIVAPGKDFREGMVREEHRMVAPDPVVLKPVVHKGEQYFLIVTAWGEEAQDQDVISLKAN